MILCGLRKLALSLATLALLLLLILAPCSVTAKGSGKGSPRREGRLLTELSCHDKHCVPAERGQPEAGAVRWTTDFAQAEAEAQASGKLIFLQFTEIPGTPTCQDYGRDVLSHSIIADLLEQAFVPCLVNAVGGGNDGDMGIVDVVERGRPPAVHFVDSNLREVAPRYQCGDLHGNLRDEADAVFHAAANALAAVEQPLPLFARLMGPVGAAAVVGLGMESEWLVFTVDSYRSAEALLGALPAALSTEVGWCGGAFQNPPRLEQAVRVEFDSSLAGAGEITTAAMALGFSPTDERTAQSFRSAKASDQKNCLQTRLASDDHRSSQRKDSGEGPGGSRDVDDRVLALHRVALTPTQAMRANAACFRGAFQEEYPVLSPRQLEQQALATRLTPGHRTHSHHAPIHYSPRHNGDL
eukprot:COSAG02_NODE_5109_length_4620_cov_3.383765_2_plen_412_part_00